MSQHLSAVAHQNRQDGSGVMRRSCSCRGSSSTCPVHCLWEKYLADIPAGTQPWQKVSPGQVLGWMRKTLQALAVSSVFSLSVGSLTLARRCPTLRSTAPIPSDGDTLRFYPQSDFAHRLGATCSSQDLLVGGATLAHILRAGQWKSAAFLGYLNQADIEKAHAQVSAVPILVVSRAYARGRYWK